MISSQSSITMSNSGHEEEVDEAAADAQKQSCQPEIMDFLGCNQERFAEA